MAERITEDKTRKGCSWNSLLKFSSKHRNFYKGRKRNYLNQHGFEKKKWHLPKLETQHSRKTLHCLTGLQ